MSLRKLKPSRVIETDALTGGGLASSRTDAVELRLVAYDTRDEYAREIKGLWTGAQIRFIQIGRYLNAAKARLQHGDYEAMVEADLPFSPRTAYQFRMAAAAVDEGRIPEDRLPPSYTIAYLLSTFDPSLLEEAKKADLLRPDVKRAEILRFREERRPADARAQALQAQREKLLRERRRLDAELARIERELGGGTIDDDATEAA
ncbi:hypothetical protein [Muricoccus radiodurans]|uniref:hypothetical protein n=1 Tax=Muricoccus radiodurans TaxID=2231721 RepID=UPI003CF3CEE8